jgi:hypothetical protein
VFGARVADLADATHELVWAVVGWLAEVDARSRTEHLTDDSGRRAAAIRLLVDLAQRPALPDIGPDELESGQWATALIAMAQPYSGPLSELLARSRPPGAPQLRGLVSRSERLCDLLREVDLAAHELSARIEKAEAAAAKRKTTPQQTRAEVARAELRALGASTAARYRG